MSDTVHSPSQNSSGSPARIYLASQSPRRAELLQQIGIEFDRLNVDVDESPLADEAPDVYVQRIALTKAKAGWTQVQDRALTKLPVLGADTAVIFAGQILGKPQNEEHAYTMLRLLSGNCHRVMTAVCFCWQQQVFTELNVSEVQFRTISELELRHYWHSGEPIGKAGGYAIQGRGAVFIEHISGSYSSVMGLPLFETAGLLAKLEVGD